MISLTMMDIRLLVDFSRGPGTTRSFRNINQALAMLEIKIF